MYIFLDDERFPENVTWVRLPNINKHQWTIVRNYEEFVDVIHRAEHIDHISFDHDLSDEHYGPGLKGDCINYDSFSEKTGLSCAKALVEWCINNDKELPNYTVHSFNPVGKANIEFFLEAYRIFREKNSTIP